MRCPECSEEMKEIQSQPQLQPIQKPEETYPIKIVFYLYHIYVCDKCGIKASKAETTNYVKENISQSEPKDPTKEKLPPER